jgi:ribosome-binding protein aMBF1 (putative translation factor)
MKELRSHWRTDQPDTMRRLERAIARDGSQRKFAQRIGMSAAFINRVVRGHDKPSIRILRELGLMREVTIKEQR